MVVVSMMAAVTATIIAIVVKALIVTMHAQMAASIWTDSYISTLYQSDWGTILLLI